MITIGANFPRLKSNLKLAIIRLNLLGKKKTELAIKMRKEIADYISDSKIERAKIKVEYVIRDDYLVEAMEKVEYFCEIVLARFGLIQNTKVIDPSISEAISSIMWAALRLQSDVPELKIVAEQLSAKYGKSYLQCCLADSAKTVNKDLMRRLNVQAPSPDMVEKYLIEIARSHSVTYMPSRKPPGDPVQFPDILLNSENEGKTTPYREESFRNEGNISSTCIQSSYSAFPDEMQNDTEVLSLLPPPPYSSLDFGMFPTISHQQQPPANPYFTEMTHCATLPPASGSVIHSDNKTNDFDISVLPDVPTASPSTDSLNQVNFDDITK